MKNLVALIQGAKNMVEIESIILTEVSNKYMNLFAETERKFIRANESQTNWITSVWAKYRKDAENDRKHLFSLIDERFHKTSMYLNLKDRLTLRSRKQANSLLA